MNFFQSFEDHPFFYKFAIIKDTELKFINVHVTFLVCKKLHYAKINIKKISKKINIKRFWTDVKLAGYLFQLF